MLQKDIGKLKNSSLGREPASLLNLIPDNLRKSQVGIFWHVGNNFWVIRKASLLDNVNACVEEGLNFGEDNNDLQIDFTHFHRDIWNDEVVPNNSNWKNVKHDYFSRGRIIYEVLKQKFTIYIPNSSLFNQEAKLFLASEFNIPFGSFDINQNIYGEKRDLYTLRFGENKVLKF